MSFAFGIGALWQTPASGLFILFLLFLSSSTSNTGGKLRDLSKDGGVIFSFISFVYDCVEAIVVLTCILRSMYWVISSLPLEWVLLPFFAVFAIPFTLFVGGKIGSKVWA